MNIVNDDGGAVNEHAPTGIPVTARADGAERGATEYVLASIPLNPLRDGDDLAASRSHFGHFMRFLTAGLPGGESLVLELRLLEAPQVFGTPPKEYGTPKTKSGYFTVSADPKTWLPMWGAIEEVLKLGPLGRPRKGVCVTLNPVIRDLLAVANGKLEAVKEGGATADRHVTARRLLLVDVDSVKSAGGVALSDVPATDAEHAAAHALADKIKADLTARGWPDPLANDSGNGAALLFHTDLPTDDGGLVERVLKALAGRYDTEAAKVDVCVHNAARLTRAPGSWNAKGADAPEVGRRHRMARIRSEPESVRLVTREQLESLVADFQKSAEPPPAPPLPAPALPAPKPRPAASGRRGRASLAPLDRARRYFGKVPGAVAGERNCALYAIAARLIGSYEVPPADVIAAAREVWAPKCSPPFDPSEVVKVVGNAACYHKGLPPPPGSHPPAGSGCVDVDGVPPAPPAPLPKGAREVLRPFIVHNACQYDDVDAQALAALVAANEQPTIFVGNGGFLSQLYQPDASEPHTVRRLDSASLRLIFGSLITWMRQSGEDVVSDFPPSGLLTSFPARGRWPGIPHLRALVTYPVYGPGWEPVAVQGYHRGTGIYCDLNGLAVPPVPDAPTPDDVVQAKGLILDELLVDFPFADDGNASRANAVAMLLLPVCRNAIDGPTPLGIIDAPTEGTGKSLLAEAVALTTVGEVPEAMAPDMRDDEWNKTLLAMLMESQPIFYLDNANRKLDSASLASALTARFKRGRVLGESRTARARVNTCWMLTANNLTCSREIARRGYWIRIDAGVETPSTWTAFRHPNLQQWVRENRPRLLWAVLVLIQNWRAGGGAWGTASLGKFEEWAGVMGGILGAAGIDGFQGNAAAFRARAADQVGEFAEFVEAWHGKYPAEAKIAGDLFHTAKGTLDSVLTAENDDGKRKQLGRFLASQRDRVVGKFRIVADSSDHSRRARYRLDPAAPSPPVDSAGDLEFTA